MCSSKARVNELMEGETAFSNMKIESYDFMDKIEGRSKCHVCNRSRKFFCYTCFVKMPPLEGKVPTVTLPIPVFIIKHPLEIDGKSTSIHGPLLAPDSVSIYNFPSLPSSKNAILVYPSRDAEDAVDFMNRVHKENNGKFPYEKVFFIDSTWNQTFKMINDPRMKDLPKVKLNGIDSLFWRYQRGNPTTHLSTIESVYYFQLIYYRVFVSEDYDGHFDNLLFFFKYMFNKIRNLYDPQKLKAYATRPNLRKK